MGWVIARIGVGRRVGRAIRVGVGSGSCRIGGVGAELFEAAEGTIDFAFDHGFVAEEAVEVGLAGKDDFEGIVGLSGDLRVNRGDLVVA